MDLETFKEEKHKLSQALEAHGRTMLVAEFKTFFDAHPEVNAVQWTQYTPYFNDGEPCTFSRHDFEFSGSFKDEIKKTDYIDPEKFSESKFYDSYYLKDNSQLAKSISKLTKNFRDTSDVFQASFGDGVQVTCTRDGFEVKDYDHD